MYKSSGDSQRLVATKVSVPSLKGNAHRHDCLPKSTTPINGYGSKGLGSHAPEVAGQHEPTDAHQVRQHHNYAAEGLGMEHSIKPVMKR